MSTLNKITDAFALTTRPMRLYVHNSFDSAQINAMPKNVFYVYTKMAAKQFEFSGEFALWEGIQSEAPWLIPQLQEVHGLYHNALARRAELFLSHGELAVSDARTRLQRKVDALADAIVEDLGLRPGKGGTTSARQLKRKEAIAPWVNVRYMTDLAGRQAEVKVVVMPDFLDEDAWDVRVMMTQGMLGDVRSQRAVITDSIHRVMAAQGLSYVDVYQGNALNCIRD